MWVVPSSPLATESPGVDTLRDRSEGSSLDRSGNVQPAHRKVHPTDLGEPMTYLHPSRRSRFVATSAAGLLAAAGTLATAAPAAADPACDTVEALMECMTVGGVTEHLTALQAIADENGGNRASGLPGHTASADYVTDRLEAAGYEVTRQPFDFDYYERGRHADVPAALPDADDLRLRDRLPGHELLRLAARSPARSSRSTSTPPTSGCEAADFPVGRPTRLP